MLYLRTHLLEFLKVFRDTKWVNGEKVLQFHEQFDVTNWDKFLFYMFIHVTANCLLYIKEDTENKTTKPETVFFSFRFYFSSLFSITFTMLITNER